MLFHSLFAFRSLLESLSEYSSLSLPCSDYGVGRLSDFLNQSCVGGTIDLYTDESVRTDLRPLESIPRVLRLSQISKSNTAIVQNIRIYNICVVSRARDRERMQKTTHRH